jgi:hypothetical protein
MKEKQFKRGELVLLRNKLPVIVIKKEKKRSVSFDQNEDKKVIVSKTYLCLIKNTIDNVSERMLNKI